MAGGLFALLDDIALIARSAAASVDDVATLAGRTSIKQPELSSMTPLSPPRSTSKASSPRASCP